MSDKDYIKTLEADNEKLRAELLLEKETSEKARSYAYEQSSRLRMARQDIDNLIRKIEMMERNRHSYSSDRGAITTYDAMKQTAYERELYEREIANAMMSSFQLGDKMLIDEELKKYINGTDSEFR